MSKYPIDIGRRFEIFKIPTQIRRLCSKCSVLELSWNLMAHGRGKWRGNMRVEWVASSLALYLRTCCIHHYYHNYCRCTHLGCQQSTELTPLPPLADSNGLVRFAERPNLVSARVPSRFKGASTIFQTQVVYLFILFKPNGPNFLS